MKEKIKVLVIDDMRLILKTTEMLLIKAGFKVETAETADLGIQKWKTWKPDCVLLDLMLPGKSGWDVLEEMKSRKDYEEIPVFIYTARDDALARQKAKEKAVAGFILKPLDPDTIGVLLTEAVAEAKAKSLTSRH